MPTTTQPATPTATSGHASRVVTRAELQSVYNIPFRRETLWRMEREGRFPRSVTSCRSRKLWRARDVEAWLESR